MWRIWIVFEILRVFLAKKSENNSWLESWKNGFPLVPLIWRAATAASSLLPLTSCAKLVVLFMEIAKFTGSWAPLSTSSNVKVQKMGEEREEVVGIRRTPKKPQQNNWDWGLGPPEPALFCLSCFAHSKQAVLVMLGLYWWCYFWFDQKFFWPKILIWFCSPAAGMGEQGVTAESLTEAFEFCQDVRAAEET